MTVAQLSSRIDRVKVYASGATVTRVAELQKADEQVEIAGLPLALDDSSVRVRVETEAENHPAIATDVRVGLAVPEAVEPEKPPAEQELRQAQKEVQRLENTIALIDNEIEVLYYLDVPNRPEGEKDKAPPPSPLNTRLALANFQDEQVRTRIAEKRETTEKLRLAQENYDSLLHKQMLASTAREAKPHELRKTVVVKLSYEGDKAVAGQRLLVEYFVPGARWTPTYVCRLDSANNTASIAVRALICQRTGEDWSGVSLELSTANPQAWCELPELHSLRWGRTQSRPQKAGRRLPTVGAEALFADYDRQREAAQNAVYRAEAIGQNQIPRVQAVLPDLKRTVQKFSEIASEKQSRSLYTSISQEKAEKKTLYDYNLSVNLDMRSTTNKREGGSQLSLREPAPNKKAKSPGLLVTTTKLYRFYSLMRMGEADNREKRGKLEIAPQQEIYLETIKQQQVDTRLFEIGELIAWAVDLAEKCLNVPLPPDCSNVRTVADSFDYAYKGDSRVDIPSDGQFHSVALTSNSTEVDLRYVVVPGLDTNVFRIAQLRNPLPAPLLAGPADVYVNGEYILSTNIATVPAKGQMELGLGVEQGIKVARNTTYEEGRSGETLVAFDELRHHITIDITNRLSRDARIEVRECLPIPAQNAKVDVAIEQVRPAWEEYKQEERQVTIKGGYRWQVEVASGENKSLSVQYAIKIFVENELVGGNRREP